jgi:DNA ligase (NAD+)
LQGRRDTDIYGTETFEEFIERLRAAGVQFEAEERELHSDLLAGKSVVISGKFRRHSRDELKELIELHGGKNLAAVSANVDYLIAGENMGPAKLQKATKLGIKMLSEEEFEALIASVPSPTAQLAHETKCEPESTPAVESAPAQLVMPIQGELF